ncbi:MAG: AAA family ATPase [Bacteroidia bacterium]|nr:AAA family ATPase [Bacteroidia bacterium]
MRIIALRFYARSLGTEDVSLQSVFRETRGIVAIDEFDRHLHPSWQKVYLDRLREVLPNIQLILTTHNPLSILGREEEEVHQLVQDEYGHLSVRHHPEGTKWMDVILVLLKYFEVDSVVSNTLQQKINRYNQLFANQGEKSEIQQLEQELKAHLINGSISDQRYLRFLELMKKKDLES